MLKQYLLVILLVCIVNCNVFPPESLSDTEIDEYFAPMNIILAILAMIVGSYLCFFGYRFLRPSLYIISFGMVFSVIYFILNGQNVLLWWINLIIAVIVAGLLSFFSVGFKIIGYFIVGFVAGFMLVGGVLFGLFGQLWAKDTWFIITQWIITSSLSLLGGIATIFAQKHFTISGTSIIGSFSLVSGFDYFLRDKFGIVIYSLLTDGVINQFYPFWLSALMIVILFILIASGCYIQYMITAHNLSHDYTKMDYNKDIKLYGYANNDDDLIVSTYS
eukprot:TRINITY_DN487_c0_g1_i1.p1 TRINITY_DN487_c0_g1~~TRINITY_DN487_c0_g1_i1.p1  ORF type:complete len:287 (+),score=39.91 TRINITY_DN487_c0_g1_i1:38-862(+)